MTTEIDNDDNGMISIPAQDEGPIVVTNDPAEHKRIADKFRASSTAGHAESEDVADGKVQSGEFD
jgi:hypothetical protein